MKALTETNEKLAHVRKALLAKGQISSALERDPKREISITIALRMPLGHFSSEWSDSAVGLNLLDYAVRDRLRANLTQALVEAERDLRAEERRLCEDLVRLAAKTASGGL